LTKKTDRQPNAPTRAPPTGSPRVAASEMRRAVSGATAEDAAGLSDHNLVSAMVLA
jgi:hypothetical protein